MSVHPYPGTPQPSQAPRMVRLFNVIDGTIQLESSDLRIGLVKPGHSVTIPESVLGHQSIVQCMAQGWLVPDGHPAIVQMQARMHGGAVTYPGANAEHAQPTGPAWAQQAGGGAVGHVPMMPGMPQAGYPGGPPMPGMPEGFHLPGMVSRSGNPELLDSPVGVTDAQSIITGGRSHPDAQVLVPDADAVFRQSLRGQNTIIPQRPGMVQPMQHYAVPPMSTDPGAPLAGGILASQQRPGQPQQNVIVGPATGYPPQPGAHTQPYGAPSASPVPPYVAPPSMGAYDPTGGQFVQANMGAQPGFPNARQVQGRGAYPRQSWVQAPPPQASPIPPGGTMGQLIVPGTGFGQAGLMDVGAQAANWGRGGDLFEATESVLHDVQQGNRQAGLVANYKEWPLQKRWHFIHTTQDLALLYKFYSMEVGAPVERRSNDMILALQQRIAMGGGQVPDMNQVQAMQITQTTQVQAQETNVLTRVMLDFPTWSDAQKLAFVNTVKDPEFLTALLQRFRNSPAVDQVLQTRIASINELIRQADQQRAAAQPTNVPTQQPPFVQTPSGAVVQPNAPPVQAQPIPGAIMDTVLTPPAQPVTPTMAPPPQPILAQVPTRPAGAPQMLGPGDVIFTPAAPQVG